jgi:hypothetical protein
MLPPTSRRHRSFCVALLLTFGGGMHSAAAALATDYFLTIGGGYDRSGNQASLEANVVFFQQLIADKHRGPNHHDIFFADGDDPAADLQVMREKSESSSLPATELLTALHRRRGTGDEVTYRNHRVPNINGPLDPARIRATLDGLAKTAKSNDRLIIYVTAHGSAGPNDDPFNTTIDCWNGRKITAREFTAWLSKLPVDVPVVMVMAQCYCGGFGNAIYEEFNAKKGLAPQLRGGFFAQQHDLPAAGCRPDIEHDEEFSSYFWGVLAGRSRNGVPIAGCDLDGDGAISFAEAYAYAVTASETIDIPLRTSEVFLRNYSRFDASSVKDSQPGVENETNDADQPESAANDKLALRKLTGKLETFVQLGRPVSRQIVTQLAKKLGFSLADDVTAVRNAYEATQSNRSQRTGRPRQGSGRRELLREVTEKWPELGDERKWSESELLVPENQERILAEIKQLPSWTVYQDRRQQMEAANTDADQREIRAVTFRKLINQIEVIALEQNLSAVAAASIVDRYQRLLSLEESPFSESHTAPAAATE